MRRAVHGGWLLVLLPAAWLAGCAGAGDGDADGPWVGPCAGTDPRPLMATAAWPSGLAGPDPRHDVAVVWPDGRVALVEAHPSTGRGQAADATVSVEGMDDAEACGHLALLGLHPREGAPAPGRDVYRRDWNGSAQERVAPADEVRAFEDGMRATFFGLGPSESRPACADGGQRVFVGSLEGRTNRTGYSCAPNDRMDAFLGHWRALVSSIPRAAPNPS